MPSANSRERDNHKFWCVCVVWGGGGGGVGFNLCGELAKNQH